MHQNKTFKRIEFSAIRKLDILDALKKPRNINQNLVDAAITRRFLDKFFGYKISPITTRRTIFGKSAGRVQSPTLKILCEREREIDLFDPKEFWEVIIEIEDENGNKMTSSIYSDNGKKIEKTIYRKSEIQATSIKDRLLKKFLIEDVVKKEKKEVLIALSQIRFTPRCIIKTGI